MRLPWIQPARVVRNDPVPIPQAVKNLLRQLRRRQWLKLDRRRARVERTKQVVMVAPLLHRHVRFARNHRVNPYTGFSLCQAQQASSCGPVDVDGNGEGVEYAALILKCNANEDAKGVVFVGVEHQEQISHSQKKNRLEVFGCPKKKNPSNGKPGKNVWFFFLRFFLPSFFFFHPIP